MKVRYKRTVSQVKKASISHNLRKIRNRNDLPVISRLRRKNQVICFVRIQNMDISATAKNENTVKVIQYV